MGEAKDTVVRVFDTLSSTYIQLMLAGFAIYSYHTVMKHKPEPPAAANQGGAEAGAEAGAQAGAAEIPAEEIQEPPEEPQAQLPADHKAVLILLICLAVLTALATMSQADVVFNLVVAWFCFVCQIITLLIQAFLPVISRYFFGDFDDDEKLIFQFKMVASSLGIFTSVVDAFSLRAEKPFKVPKWMPLSMVIATGAMNLSQMLLRLVGPQRAKDFVNLILSKTYAAFLTVGVFFYQQCVVRFVTWMMRCCRWVSLLFWPDEALPL